MDKLKIINIFISNNKYNRIYKIIYIYDRGKVVIGKTRYLLNIV